MVWSNSFNPYALLKNIIIVSTSDIFFDFFMSHFYLNFILLVSGVIKRLILVEPFTLNYNRLFCKEKCSFKLIQCCQLLL